MTAWTREKPTKPGWYWWREFEGGDVEIYRVREMCGTVFIRGMLSLDLLNGEWQGPLVPNE